MQRQQGGIRLAGFDLTDQRLTQACLIGQIVLRPRFQQSAFPRSARAIAGCMPVSRPSSGRMMHSEAISYEIPFGVSCAPIFRSLRGGGSPEGRLGAQRRAGRPLQAPRPDFGLPARSLARSRSSSRSGPPTGLSQRESDMLWSQPGHTTWRPDMMHRSDIVAAGIPPRAELNKMLASPASTDVPPPWLDR